MKKEKRILKEALTKSDRLICVDFKAQWRGKGFFDILILTKMHYKVIMIIIITIIIQKRIIDIAKNTYYCINLTSEPNRKRSTIN